MRRRFYAGFQKNGARPVVFSTALDVNKEEEYIRNTTGAVWCYGPDTKTACVNYAVSIAKQRPHTMCLAD